MDFFVKEFPVGCVVDAVDGIFFLRTRHCPADDAQRHTNKRFGANQGKILMQKEAKRIVFNNYAMVLTNALQNSRAFVRAVTCDRFIYSNMCWECKDPDVGSSHIQAGIKNSRL